MVKVEWLTLGHVQGDRQVKGQLKRKREVDGQDLANKEANV